MTPEPTPVTSCPNGEKPCVEIPSAVIVTTDALAPATIAVRSAASTVRVIVVEAVFAVAGEVVAAGVDSRSTSAVPVEARAADRSETARIGRKRAVDVQRE